jgi:glycosyltransferase involved in cell wall biosynthesis
MAEHELARSTNDAAPPQGAPFPRTVSTLDWWRRPRWTSRVEIVRRDPSTAIAIRRLVGAALAAEAVVLDGATGGAARTVDLGAAAALALRRTGPAVVVTDATWSVGDGALDRLTCRLGLAAIDGPRVSYCVLTSAERDTFPRTWGVSPERVFYTPFYYTASDEDLDAPVPDHGGVFAGGDSLRDYRPLLAAARHLRAPMTLATRCVPEEARRGLPGHVKVGFLPHAEYMRRMREATVVVVPLAARWDRGAGQQTYLNAMAMGKLVVVPDVMGVRDYIEDGRTGLVVPARDGAALEGAIRWAIDPAHRAAVRGLGARARDTVRARFSPERYVDAVLEVVEASVRRVRGLRRGGLQPAPAVRPAPQGT